MTVLPLNNLIPPPAESWAVSVQWVLQSWATVIKILLLENLGVIVAVRVESENVFAVVWDITTYVQLLNYATTY